ncbi:nicotinate-nucleotide--dimethylbenzimidazole phosphoribosyltransferase [Streptomyces mangrovisoli]|uniref:Nicotinate-nucleotide--dimethylbenzimidazole phosphoribosyltransferase n=1 Tax=Streptomyces mangrovisoli TaxID=1428628 RepID=A0A1J4NWK6_9ACTN|nr:nicotinate-nucleotide--dimethylbenzimidazole phosphoribosyltransferase [Streptomyces mangrovisoli]OIJ66680.1 5,6-dimethylbenzimidazole synthase [Streptomyces mangrovisoli]
MTDTGQVPGEGLPESAGMVEQPGAPAHGAYTYLSETTAEDEDLLLLPGAQGAWGNEVPPPMPEPVVETVHEPGPHETAGRDTGSVDLGAVRLPSPAQAAPAAPIPPVTPRRPLHLGPPIPDASASPVRSLADRGPAHAPLRQPAPVATAGPEYLDLPPTATPPGGTAWTGQAAPVVPVGSVAPAAETVAPDGDTATATPAQAVGAADAALAAVARLTTVATGHTPAPGYGAPAAETTPEAGPAAVFGSPAEVAYGSPAGPDPAAPGHGTEHGIPGGEAAQGAPSTDAPDTGADAPEASAAGPDAAHDPATGEQRVLGGPVAQDVPAAQDAPARQDVSAASDVPPVDAAPVVPGPVPGDNVSFLEAFTAGEGWAAPGDAPQAADAGESADGPAPADAAVPPAEQTPAVAVAVAAVPDPAQGPDAAFAPEPAQTGPETPFDPQGAPNAAPSTGADAFAGADPSIGADAFAGADPSIGADAFAAPAGATPAAGFPVAPAAEPHLADPAAATAPTAVPAEPGPAPLAAADAVAAPPVPAATDAPGDLARPQDPDAPQAVQGAEEAPAGQHDLSHPTETDLNGADPHLPLGDPVAPLPAGAGTGAPAEQAAPQPGEPADGTASPLGEFVPVEGTVPTTPHLAPTPPHALRLPADGPHAQDPQPAVHQDLSTATHQDPPPTAPAQDAQDVQDVQDAGPGHAADPQGEPLLMVPAPRDGDLAAAPVTPEGPHPDVVQQADDLTTQVADQEESAAAVAEAEQSTGPAAPAYDDAEREAVLKVIRERRDIRNGFRSDPIPHEVLLRVLEAAHTAPSVGHSQPWDFVVIRSADTRRAMHELAMRQRDAYAKSLPKGRAKQFKELKIEAILDTPVNILVTADPTRGGRHTLGRHTQPQMAPYSSALAVENLWLAARAEGLGVGWVSFFDEREMVRALGLPDHLEAVAYLCVGYVDEFPEEPELMQAGWSKRRPLSWVVHEETYGRRALPGEEPHDLLGETVAGIRPLDAKALGEAWERQKRMTKPAGALGMLEIISAQLSGLSRQCPPPIPEPAAVAIFAGDHGVHAQGVTPWPQEVTAQMVANFLGGGAVCNAFAGQVGAEVCVIDVGVASDLPATPGLLPRKVRAGTSDMTTGPAMTREEARQAIEVGIETARDLVAAGNKALLTGEMGIANTTASAALISVFTGADPAEVTGRGTGINDETLARKTEVVRRALELHQPDPADPIGVLAAIGGFEHAAMVGLLLGGASLRTPVILDGVSAGAAALVARAIAPEVLAACIAGHRSAEPGHVAALNKLGLRPLVDLDLRLGEGTGALLALPLVQSTARAMHEVATFDSAGVTEK